MAYHGKLWGIVVLIVAHVWPLAPTRSAMAGWTPATSWRSPSSPFSSAPRIRTRATRPIVPAYLVAGWYSGLQPRITEGTTMRSGPGTLRIASCLILVLAAVDAPAVQATARVPILLVHGWHGCPSSATWGHMKPELEALGFRVEYFDNVPLDDTGCQRSDVPIAGLVEYLSAKVREIRAACEGCMVDIVAHSLGALVTRAWITGLGPAPYEKGTLRRFISAGVPNFGFETPLEAFLDDLQLREMSHGSQFLWELHQATIGLGPRRLEGAKAFQAVESLAVIGSYCDDGDGVHDGDCVVNKNSANLRPYGTPERVVPYFHGALCAFRRCLVNVDAGDHLTYQIVRSFLADGNGCADSDPRCWKTIGEAFKSPTSEVLLGVLGHDDRPLATANLSNVQLHVVGDATNRLKTNRRPQTSDGELFYADDLPPGPYAVEVVIGEALPSVRLFDCRFAPGEVSVLVLKLVPGGQPPSRCHPALRLELDRPSTNTPARALVPPKRPPTYRSGDRMVVTFEAVAGASNNVADLYGALLTPDGQVSHVLLLPSWKVTDSRLVLLDAALPRLHADPTPWPWSW